MTFSVSHNIIWLHLSECFIFEKKKTRKRYQQTKYKIYWEEYKWSSKKHSLQAIHGSQHKNNLIVYWRLMRKFGASKYHHAHIPQVFSGVNNIFRRILGEASLCHFFSMNLIESAAILSIFCGLPVSSSSHRHFH